MKVKVNGWEWSTRSLALFAGVGLLCAGFATPLHAQSFSIDWSKIGAGGGTSTNAQFSVTGTVGQPEAGGTLTGGSYALTGGFWCVLTAVQTPGAPKLSIAVTDLHTFTISWPTPVDAFVLQQNSTLSSATWIDITDTVNSGGGVDQVVVSFPIGNRFYRLLRR